MDPDRVRSYLKTACSTLNFDVGEIWCSRAKNMIGGRKDELRFIQLHMTSTYEKIRSKLLQPTRIPDKQELERHSFSPVICDHVRNGGQLVWANTETMSGVLGRSDLPLRTAVGMPICCVGYDLCILVLFSPKYLEATHDRREFLYALATASSDSLSGFLPASISSPIRSVVAESNPFGTVILPSAASAKRPFSSFRDTSEARRRGGSAGSKGGRDSASPDPEALTRVTRLQRGIIVQMWALHDIPKLRGALPEAASAAAFDASSSMTSQGHPASAQRKSPGRSRANSFVTSIAGYGSGRASPAIPGEPLVPTPTTEPPGGGNLDDLIWNSIVEDFDLEGDGLEEQDNTLGMGLGIGLGAANGPGSSYSIATSGRSSPRVLDQYLAPPTSAPPSRPPSVPLSYGDNDSLGFGADDLQDIASLLNAASSNNAAVATAARERLVSSGASARANTPAPTQVDADELDVRIKRFEEFITGFMGMSVFHAADLWVMVSGGEGQRKAEQKDAPAEDKEEEAHTPGDVAHVSGATITTADEERARRAVLKRSKNKEVTPQGGISNVSVIDDEPGVLRLACSHVADEALQAWPTYTSSFRFEPGQGFPGQVLEKGTAQWETDFGKLSPLDYPRAAAAKELGLHTAFGVPLPAVYDPELRRVRSGVLMFYSMSVVQARPLMLGFVERAAALLWGALASSLRGLSLAEMCMPGGDRDPAVRSPSWSGNGRGRSRTPPLPSDSPGLEDAKDLLQLRRTATPVTVPVPRSRQPTYVTEDAGPSGFVLNGLDVRWDPQKRQWVTEEKPPPPPDRRSYSPAYSPGLDLLNSRVESMSPGFPLEEEAHHPALARSHMAHSVPVHPHQAPSFDPYTHASRAREASRPPSLPPHMGDRPVQPVPRVPQPGYFGFPAQPAGPGYLPGSMVGPGAGGPAAPGFLPGQSLNPAWSAAAAAMWMPTMDMQLPGPFGFAGMSPSPAVQPQPSAAKMVMQGMPPQMGAFRPDMAQMLAGTRRPPSVAAAARPQMPQPFAQGRVGARSQSLSPEPQLDPAAQDPKHCRVAGCRADVIRRTLYCAEHSSVRHCQYEGCTKCAQGSTKFCIRHGGGRRCTYPGCTKGARDKYFCAAHGGGKRCTMEGCTKAAVGGSNLCTAHGGGRRCQYQGCNKSAQSSTNYCVRHGGGRKCQVETCEKVARGRTRFCAAHGGGVRCRVDGCKKAAVGQFQLCRVHAGTAQPKKRPAAEVLTAAELARLTESARQRFN